MRAKFIKSQDSVLRQFENKNKSEIYILNESALKEAWVPIKSREVPDLDEFDISQTSNYYDIPETYRNSFFNIYELRDKETNELEYLCTVSPVNKIFFKNIFVGERFSNGSGKNGGF